LQVKDLGLTIPAKPYKNLGISIVSRDRTYHHTVAKDSLLFEAGNEDAISGTKLARCFDVHSEVRGEGWLTIPSEESMIVVNKAGRI
jgi:hypothetical protein